MDSHVKNTLPQGPVLLKKNNFLLRNFKNQVFNHTQNDTIGHLEDSKYNHESKYLTTESYFNTTKSQLNYTQEGLANPSKFRKALKSSQNFRKTFQYDRSQEQDINPLLNMYKMNETDYNKSNRSKDYDQDSVSNSEEVFRKYQIKNKLDEVEKQYINKVIKISDMVKSDEERESKGYCKIRNEYYQSPYSSFQTLKLNRQIVQNVNKILANKQIDQYMEIVEKDDKIKETLRKMPEVKVNSNSLVKDEKDYNSLKVRMKSISNNSINMINVNINNSEFPLSNQELMSKFSREHLLHKGLDFHCTVITSLSNKPKSRKLTSMVLVDDTIFIFGGVNSACLDDLWIADIKNYDFKWRLMKPTAKFNPNGRYGHSAVFYNNNLYIYGGYLNDYSFMNKEYIDYIIVYEILSNRYTFELCQNKKEVKMRRNHICELVNSQMVIHGGLDEDYNFLNDFYYLELITMKWIKLEVSGEKPYLAFHSSALVISSENRSNPSLHVYKFPEQTFSINKKVIKFNKKD